uniref:Heat shock cognate 70 kDa protein-like n=1 Tax=Tanacetum cinerariifolium TaxID=118510 RepID=A0A6L2NDQ4_TANCI|nr:heat shock cognate 70 kDa protein-like [Tanacetum cinerariifolium]
MEFSRAKFEELNDGFFRKCLQHVDDCLKDGNMNKNKVDDVVIVGGSTRIPKIQQMLMDFFDGKSLCKSINADEAVAYGAAVLAANLNGSGSKNTQDLVPSDVTPLSLGVEIKEVEMSVVIPRNTPIPTTMRSSYQTRYDNQEFIPVNVYQGEGNKTKDNIFLDSFKLEGVPPAPAEDPFEDHSAPLAISPFHDYPYIKVMQAHNATNSESPIPPPRAPIAPPTVLPPSLVLQPSSLFDPQNFFLLDEILPP